MTIGSITTRVLAALAVSSLALAPMASLAQGKGNGNSKQHSNNGKAPKKNGRHDNRRVWDNDSRTYRVYDSSREAERYRVTYAGQSQESRRRQQTKNEWRNLAYLAGGVALLGLLNKDNTLVFAGTAGALYSLHRYEQDRKSQSKLDRLRAHYFSQSYFTRDGKRYERRLVNRNGKKYYQFVRAR